MLLIPPSRYKWPMTSKTPLYFALPACPSTYIPSASSMVIYGGRCTCSNTFARSTGAVTRVVGTADMKPAAASSAVERDASFRLGVKVYIRALEASYA